MTIAQVQPMRAGKSITIISVTGHQDYAQGSAYAIERSFNELLKKFPAEQLKCVLVSPEKPEECHPYIIHIPCEPFSYLEYNLYLLYLLDPLVTTDFALIVQNDGFILNGDNWQDEFFDYDYIGAPLLTYISCIDGGYQQYGRAHWIEHCNHPPENLIEPMNGGFSLRSKRLLGILREMNIQWSLPIPKVLHKLPAKLEYPALYHHEDLFLTGYKRRELEECGIRFAPSEIASYFSLEDNLIVTHRKLDITKIFGCHLMGYFVLSKPNIVLMNKRVDFEDGNVMTNPFCYIALQSGIDISIPQHFWKDEMNNFDE